MTIIEQIKTEIEKLIERYGSVEAKGVLQEGYKGGRLIGYEDALDILKRIQEESEKPIILDGLEEELDKWRHEHFHGKRDDHFSGEYLERTSQLDLARHFANWQKEQMMKDAVEGEVDFEYFGYKVIRPVLKQLDTLLESMNHGDKVRIIIVKEDEK